nr:Rnase P, protein component 4 [uncultured archaeon]
MRDRRLVLAVATDALYGSARRGGEAGELLAGYARELLEKAGLRRPYEYRLIFCRKCKRYSPIGVTRSVRVRRGRIVFHCSLCGATYRVVRGRRGTTRKAIMPLLGTGARACRPHTMCRRTC